MESLWTAAPPLGTLSGLGENFASSLGSRAPHSGPLGNRSPGSETLLGSLIRGLIYEVSWSKTLLVILGLGASKFLLTSLVPHWTKVFFHQPTWVAARWAR